MTSTGKKNPVITSVEDDKSFCEEKNLLWFALRVDSYGHC